MTQSVVIIGTSHRLQGAENYTGSRVDAPPYLRLLELFVASHEIDCIFEEASGLGPTIAQKSFPGIRYCDVDVDPKTSQRHDLGIESGYDCQPIDATDPTMMNDCYGTELVDRQVSREEFWLKRMQQERFANALVVCGFAHMLSLAFRVRSAGYQPVEVFHYTPYDRLCGHQTKNQKPIL
jgi:hypothetical protein